MSTLSSKISAEIQLPFTSIELHKRVTLLSDEMTPQNATKRLLATKGQLKEIKKKKAA
jgi:hypothetical protein